MTEGLNHFKTQLQNALPFLPGGLFSDVKREAALSNLDKSGIPTKRHEDWRYSDPTPMSKNLLAPVKKLSLNDVNKPPFLTAWPKLIFLNGHLVQNDCAKVKGIECLDFAGAIEGPDWCQKIIGLYDNDPVGDLNVAFLQGGAAIRITTDFLDQGIEIINIISGDTYEACHTRNLFWIEEGASASIATNTLSEGSLGWINHENHMFVEKGATLHHYNDLTGKALGFLSIGERVTLNGGSYNQYCLAMNKKALRHTVSVAVQSPASECNLYGAFLARNMEVSDTLTHVSHEIPHATSEQYFRGVVRDQSSGAFQGKVIVKKDAQKTVANQSCKTMILDSEAEANIKPQLLIYADDVKCAHGATVGELDKDALFYLTQRGVSPERAQSMLINAFLAHITEYIEVASIKEIFEQKVESWMAQGGEQKHV